MDARDRSLAAEVAKLVAAEPDREFTCVDLASKVIVSTGPSRFPCPPASMKRLLDGLVHGGHLAVRRARTNLYRLHPDARKRSPIPAGWFFDVMRGTHRSWPVIVTDRWGNGSPVMLFFDEGRAVVSSGATLFCEVAFRHGDQAAKDRLDRVAREHGWSREESAIVAPWADAERLADVLAGARA